MHAAIPGACPSMGGSTVPCRRARCLRGEEGFAVPVVEACANGARHRRTNHAAVRPRFGAAPRVLVPVRVLTAAAGQRPQRACQRSRLGLDHQARRHHRRPDVDCGAHDSSVGPPGPGPGTFMPRRCVRSPAPPACLAAPRVGARGPRILRPVLLLLRAGARCVIIVLTRARTIMTTMTTQTRATRRTWLSAGGAFPSA
jgi:hypothetical protein